MAQTGSGSLYPANMRHTARRVSCVLLLIRDHTHAIATRHRDQSPGVGAHSTGLDRHPRRIGRAFVWCSSHGRQPRPGHVAVSAPPDRLRQQQRAVGEQDGHATVLQPLRDTALCYNHRACRLHIARWHQLHMDLVWTGTRRCEEDTVAQQRRPGSPSRHLSHDACIGTKVPYINLDSRMVVHQCGNPGGPHRTLQSSLILQLATASELRPAEAQKLLTRLRVGARCVAAQAVLSENGCHDGPVHAVHVRADEAPGQTVQRLAAQRGAQSQRRRSEGASRLQSARRAIMSFNIVRPFPQDRPWPMLKDLDTRTGHLAEHASEEHPARR